MKVKITTDFGEMTFEMPQAAASALIDQAMKAADICVSRPAWQPPESEPERVNVPGPVPSDDTPEAEKPRSRVETMFGERRTWDMPAAKERREFRLDKREPYKGFLHIKCEACGMVKSFCAKKPTTFHICTCGHKTELRDLRFAHVRCGKCGGEFTYKTNIEEDFTISCLRCTSPVDMELGAKGTAFVPVGQPSVGGVCGNGKPLVFRQNHNRYR